MLEFGNESLESKSARESEDAASADVPAEVSPNTDAVSHADGVNVSLDNLGPIVHCDIPLIPGCVTLLCGKNGTGKTTAQKAITGVLAKSGKELNPRDGVSAGAIEMPGVRVRIGKKMTIKGDPGETFVMIEDGDEINKFIDPGIAKPSSADAKRIEALLSMSGAVIGDAVFSEFVGEADWKEFCEAIDTAKYGPVDRVAKLKRWLDSRARTAEIDLDQATGAITQIGPIPAQVKPVDQQALSKQQTELITQIATANEAIRGSKMAADSLASLSEVTGDPVALDAEIAAADVDLENIEKAEDELEKQLHDLQTRKESARNVRHEKVSRRDSLRRFVETRDKLAEESKTTWTAEAVAELQTKADAIADQIRQAVVAQESEKTRATKVASLEHQERKKKSAEQRSKRFRDLASRTPVILSDAVKNLEGWSIMNHDGEIRLMCQHKRGMICFDQLSPGEAVARALDVRCQPRDFRGRVAVASLDAERWAALDGDAKEQVLLHLQKTGIALVTSRCSEGDDEKDLHVKIIRPSAVTAIADVATDASV